MKDQTLPILSLILIAAVAAAAAVVFFSQDEKNDTLPNEDIIAVQGTHFGLSEETETKIRQDYLDLHIRLTNPDATIDDVWIRTYSGTFDGCVAVIMGDRFRQYITAIFTETIDGVLFVYPNSNMARAWKEGEFHRFQEAYDMGLLVRDDLERIASIVSMSWETEKQVRQGYVETYVKLYDSKATADRVWIESNYTPFYPYRCIALMMWYGEDSGTDGKIRETYAAGELFRYDSEHRIIVWKEGSFCELWEAYDLGLLTKDDIKTIAKYRRAAYPPLYEDDVIIAPEGTHFGLSQNTENRIKQDYLTLFTAPRNPGAAVDDVRIIAYGGTYGGCAVVVMGDIFSSYLTDPAIFETIDGIRINTSWNPIRAWKDGSFCSLREAYDGGMLIRDDIETIAHLIGMYWETEKQVRQDYVDAYVRPHDPAATADRVWIERNYGIGPPYPGGNCIALMMWYGENSGTDGMIREYYAAGELFLYDSEHRIIAWNGSFYELHEAYDLGFLTKEDIKTIARHHRAAHPSLYAGR